MSDKVRPGDAMGDVERHIAGATVSHVNPFLVLQAPVDDQDLPADIRETWVRPIYSSFREPGTREFVARQLPLVTDELIAGLLANFDWRPRTAAAYLAALSDRQAFTTQIGHLLLRSDVCFAGSAYCIALAGFNSRESVGFLDQYLGYYLTRHDLWFEQGDAMGALAYLDRVNGTANLDRHLRAWNRFVENKPHWNLVGSIAHFEEDMAILNSLKTPLGRAP